MCKTHEALRRFTRKAYCYGQDAHERSVLIAVLVRTTSLLGGDVLDLDEILLLKLFHHLKGRNRIFSLLVQGSVGHLALNFGLSPEVIVQPTRQRLSIHNWIEFTGGAAPATQSR